MRIDSPDGPVIGQSNRIDPIKGTSPNFNPTFASIKVSPIDGFHDVYFIFRNEQAPAGQALFIMTNIKFETDGKAFRREITMK